MTNEEAIKLLDSETTKEAIAAIEKAAGENGRVAAIAAIEQACEQACKVMRCYKITDEAYRRVLSEMAQMTQQHTHEVAILNKKIEQLEKQLEIAKLCRGSSK